MQNRLKDKHIAFVAGHGVEAEHLTKPMQELQKLGAKVSVVSDVNEPQLRTQGSQITQAVDQKAAVANHAHFDAVIVSGGTPIGSPQLHDFLNRFQQAGKPVAIAGHRSALELAAAAQLLKGRKVTATPELKQYVEDAGARWSSNEVEIDKLLITTHHNKHPQAFNEAIVAAVGLSG